MLKLAARFCFYRQLKNSDWSFDWQNRQRFSNHLGWKWLREVKIMRLLFWQKDKQPTCKWQGPKWLFIRVKASHLDGTSRLSEILFIPVYMKNISHLRGILFIPVSLHTYPWEVFIYSLFTFFCFYFNF